MEDSVAVAMPPLEAPLLSTKMAEEGRLCPLCKSEIRLFFINFNEKMLMCENANCEFPFGYEELQFFKEDNEMGLSDEVASLKTKDSCATVTGSVVSAATWAEIDRLNQTCENDDLQGMSLKPTSSKETDEMKKMENDILKHVNEIKELNKELMDNDSTNVIKNEKWIKNLKSMQQISGLKLLKPQEIGLLRKEEPVIGLGELKIDISPGNANCLSSIMIEICNKSDGTDTKVNKDPK